MIIPLDSRIASFTAAVIIVGLSCGSGAVEDVGRVVHTVEIPLPVIETVGFNTTEPLDIPIPDGPVPVEGMSRVWFDHVRLDLHRPVAGGSHSVYCELTLLSHENDQAEPESILQTSPHAEFSLTGGRNYGVIYRFGGTIVPGYRLADTLRVKLWITQQAPGEGPPTATARGFNGEDSIRLHFVQGDITREDSGVHELRIHGQLPSLQQDGPGETPWSAYIDLNPPVSCSGLKFVRISSFGIHAVVPGEGPNATTVAELLLDDGSALLLDDARSPSTRHPVAGYISANHALLLNRGTRLQIHDRMIERWRWKVVNEGEGAFTITPRESTRCYFIYDDRVSFERGNANGDAALDIADAIFIFSYLFAHGPSPSCLDAADANDDGAVDLGDGIYILQSLFAGGLGIPRPSPGCGIDPTVDTLGCASYPVCEQYLGD